MRTSFFVLLLIVHAACADMFVFPATSKIIGHTVGQYPTEVLEREPALFAADMNFALEHGGPITRAVLQEILKIPYVQAIYTNHIQGYHIIIDSRVHKLEQGEYPAIPGWHTDFVERSSRTNMQPDYTKITSGVKTYVVNISDQLGGVSNTEYLTETVELEVPKDQVYLSIDKQLQAKKKLALAKLVDGEIIEMDQLSLHRGIAAHRKGMRYFLRLAVLHDLTTTILQTAPQNEIRDHLQSYFDMNMALKDKGVATARDLSHNSSELSFLASTSELQQDFSVKQLKSEPMIVNGSFSFARKNGGQITQHFLDIIQTDPIVHELIAQGMLEKIRINTRVHMLMRGQYPDLNIWRNTAPFAEDIYSNDPSTHFLVTLSSKPHGVSAIEFSDPQIGKLQDKKLIRFSNGAVNRSCSAHDFGWRLLILASIDDNIAIENKIIKQVSIYLDDVSLGW